MTNYAKMTKAELIDQLAEVYSELGDLETAAKGFKVLALEDAQRIAELEQCVLSRDADLKESEGWKGRLDDCRERLNRAEQRVDKLLALLMDDPR